MNPKSTSRFNLAKALMLTAGLLVSCRTNDTISEETMSPFTAPWTSLLKEIEGSESRELASCVLRFHVKNGRWPLDRDDFKTYGGDEQCSTVATNFDNLQFNARSDGGCTVAWQRAFGQVTINLPKPDGQSASPPEPTQENDAEFTKQITSWIGSFRKQTGHWPTNVLELEKTLQTKGIPCNVSTNRHVAFVGEKDDSLKVTFRSSDSHTASFVLPPK